jgi:hypothetical protein
MLRRRCNQTFSIDHFCVVFKQSAEMESCCHFWTATFTQSQIRLLFTPSSKLVFGSRTVQTHNRNTLDAMRTTPVGMEIGLLDVFFFVPRNHTLSSTPYFKMLGLKRYTPFA